VRPVFNYYNKFSSTKYVNGNTTKPVFPTQNSHVNYLVMDSEWEGIAAKTLEELPQVKSYVKNQFLGFTIPYVKEGKDRLYFPDFIVTCTGKDGTIKEKSSKSVDLVKIRQRKNGLSKTAGFRQ
jgi:type III restriction enzyme